MVVTSDFEGGNAKIVDINEDIVSLEVELGDTVDDWFFWCFKVCGAQGKRVTFNFESEARIGYYGAAISYDLKNWHWQYKEPKYSGGSFTYTFGEDEEEVYFAHDMVYRPERFFEFAKGRDFEVKTLCTSEKGRAVPYIDIGEGEECILLTARHHACESTGSYVLEGVLEEIGEMADKFRIICVPFVDFDGVVEGDQGKNRNGCDHNRDYDRAVVPKYKSTAEIRKIADRENIRFAFDFHSPWHIGAENDTVFIPWKHFHMEKKINELSRLFEAENNENSLPHYSKDNIAPDEKWNTHGSTCFGTYMGREGVDAELSFTLETAYFVASDVMFTPERARETGRCFVRALKKYAEL